MKMKHLHGTLLVAACLGLFTTVASGQASTLKVNSSSNDARAVIAPASANDPDPTDGLIVPRINAFPGNASGFNNAPAAASKGMLVYLQQSFTGDGNAAGYVQGQVYAPGYYYWSGTQWLKFNSTANATATTNAKDSSIYNSDGTLTGDRTISMGSNNLTFANPTSLVKVNGNLSAGGSLAVTGNAGISGGAQINQNLTVLGNFQGYGYVGTNGNMNAGGSLTIGGVSVLNGALTVAGIAAFNGTSNSFANSVGVAGTLTVNGATNFNGNANAFAHSMDVGENLTVHGNFQGYGYVGANGNMNAGGSLTIGGVSVLNGALTVAGIATFNGTSNSFANSVLISQNLNVNGNITGAALVTGNGSLYSSQRSNYYLSLQSDRNMVLYDNGAGVWSTGTSLSDIRTKTDIKAAPSLLSKMKELDIIDFKYKPELNLGNEQRFGVIAQELIKTFPQYQADLIYHDKKSDRYIVHYDKLSVIALKAIQEQQAEIETLKTENIELKKLAAQVKEMQQVLGLSPKAATDNKVAKQ